MSDGIDKSLLDRLQALRGTSSSSTSRQAATSNNNPIKFNVIERAGTPTGGDLLAARLKSLRDQASDSPRPSQSTKTTESAAAALAAPSNRAHSIAKAFPVANLDHQEHTRDEDALLETSDQALEEMLAEDIDLSPPAPKQPAAKQKQEEEIKALLERLSASVPTDQRSDDDQEVDHDDSDSETTTSQTSALIAQYKDEAELDRFVNTTSPSPPPAADTTPPQEAIELPSAPETETSISSTSMADLTARMAALRHSLPSPELLPSVPTSQPSNPSKSVKRLTSKTAYTDNDMDSWCTVCLEDATLRCTGCDGDVYCTRCWREMHLGPAAHFDDMTHRAVQFTREGGPIPDKKIALGA
ncbi:hypothetical protein E4U55_007198 [Claviceps digitariae]|nr:hypothetical protein E4U55_007198 [Claviceps digitariae]